MMCAHILGDHGQSVDDSVESLLACCGVLLGGHNSHLLGELLVALEHSLRPRWHIVVVVLVVECLVVILDADLLAVLDAMLLLVIAYGAALCFC